MTAPAIPTLDTLVAEALAKAQVENVGSVSYSQMLTRAKTVWMEEIKNDIWQIEKRLKGLQTVGMEVTTVGINEYSWPSDYASDMEMTLLDGSVRGTAQGGAVGYITLQADLDLQDSTQIVGQYVIIVSGTGLRSFSKVVTWDNTTKRATVSPNFTVAPTSTSGYLVGTVFWPLPQKPIWFQESFLDQGRSRRPSAYSPIGDAAYGSFALDFIPDLVYAIRQRYYVNLLTLDLDGTLMANLYQRWRNIWTQGVFARALQAKDDERADAQIQLYVTMVKLMVAQEAVGADLNNMQQTVSDYC